MQTSDSVIKAIEDSLEIARVIYNSCLDELLKREAKRVNFIKRGEILSFEGKTNTTGWMYRNKHIVFDGQEIGLKISGKRCVHTRISQ